MVSDYYWLPKDLSSSWVAKATSNYIILDKASRLPQSEQVVHQKNVGQNIYDLYDFIVKNYDNLPDRMVFCRAAIFFPKGREKPLSSGNCSEEVFFELANKDEFTEIHDYGPEVHDGFASKCGADGSFWEINNSWYLNIHRGKYFKNLNDFFKDLYVNEYRPPYVRFSPGASYVIPKEYVLRRPKYFYERIRHLLGWGIVIGEAHMLERATYTIFNSTEEVREKYLRPNIWVKLDLVFKKVKVLFWYLLMDIKNNYILQKNEKLYKKI